MPRKCCVVNCSSGRKDHLHIFPRSETGLQKWLECLNSDYLRNLDIQVLRQQFVCQKHFEKRFIISNPLRSRLRANAYPTLFTDDEIASGETSSCLNITQTVSSIGDHDYYKKRRHEDHTYSCSSAKRARMDVDMEDPSFIVTKENVEIDAILSTKTSDAQDMEHNTSKMEDPSGIVTKENVEIDATLSTKTSDAQDMEHNTSNAVMLSTPRLLVRKKRVILNKKSLTPNCRRLYTEYAKCRKRLNFSQRVKRAVKFSKESSFEKLTANMTPLAKQIMWMQIKQCTKNPQGRRFTLEEKLISLAIMKQSPKCYKFLHKIFILPSKYTLNKMIAGLNIEAGINTRILEAVKQEVSRWDEKKRYCSILFDEVALEAAVAYDKHNDKINGFVDLNERQNEFADHALVFMLRGTVHKWQQPLAFYFCKGATSAINLKNILKEVVSSVGDVGLIPIALVCDQGTAFQSALKSLQEDTRREQIKADKKLDDVIIINDHTLSVFYDAPHLIKGLRNNFLTKNIKYKGKICKWSDIVDVYLADCNHAQMRLLPKLTDEHVLPEKVKKMKVKNCVKVFSKSVAATLQYTSQFSHYANGEKVSPTLQNTAELVSFFDDLFDSVNGASLRSKNSHGKKLRQAVVESSQHHSFWKEAIQKLKDIKFVNSEGKDTSVPSLVNWTTTLKSYQRVWQFLKEKGVKIMRPRYLNSDPLENFFGQIRAYNFRNNDPDCHTFKSTFRSLMITRFLKFHSDSYNCEEDSGEQMLKLKSLFDEDPCNKEKKLSNVTEDNCLPEFSQSTSSNQEKVAIHSRAYTTGWVLRKIAKQNKCEMCNNFLYATKERNVEKNNINNFIAHKEYKNCKKDDKLTYPSEYAVRAFGDIIDEANKFLESRPAETEILKKITNIVTSRNLFASWDCELHRKELSEQFIKLTLRLSLFNWCNIINRILKGTDVFRLRNKRLPLMQDKAYNKYKTKLKNKRLNK